MNHTGKICILLGLLLIAAALLLTAYNLYDELRAEQSARQAVDRLEESFHVETEDTPAQPEEQTSASEEIEIPDYVLNPDMEMPVETINGIDYIGVLRIPQLELELPVISQWSDSALKIAPCRYSGSAYSAGFTIAAHNYRSHFGNLKNLREGDVLTFTDMDGNVFTYTVAACETLPPSAVEEMESGAWDLTLFTCTVGGQSRITIRCETALTNESDQS